MRSEKGSLCRYITANGLKALEKEISKPVNLSNFGQMPSNNAYLMTVALYHRHFHLFEAVLKREQQRLNQEN
jgi:hypothetical protein